MAVTEGQRRTLFVKLEELLGGEAADHLMQMLPRISNDVLVTRADLNAQTGILRGEMAELRGEMAELRAEVRTEIAGLQRWMAGVIAANAVVAVTAVLT